MFLPDRLRFSTETEALAPTGSVISTSAPAYTDLALVPAANYAGVKSGRTHLDHGPLYDQLLDAIPQALFAHIAGEVVC